MKLISGEDRTAIIIYILEQADSLTLVGVSLSLILQYTSI